MKSSSIIKRESTGQNHHPDIHLIPLPMPVPVPVPLVPRAVRPVPKPLPICDPAREPALAILLFPNPDTFALDAAPPPRTIPPLPRVVLAPPLVPLPAANPRPRPLVDDDVAVVVLPPASRLCSRSSTRRRASSRLRSSSAARRCTASCSTSFSSSIASRSLLAPFQSLLRMRRWLCSVCDRIRVQVLRRVEALVTVWDTDYLWSYQHPLFPFEILKWLQYLHPCSPWPALGCQ